MAFEFNPRFTVKSRKLPQWQAAEQMGQAQTATGAKTVIRLDELIAEQARDTEQRASGDGA